MAAVTWDYYWTNDGPYVDELARLEAAISTTTSDEPILKAELKKLKEKRDAILSTSLDWLYGYTKHVAVVIARFCIDAELTPEDTDGRIAEAFGKLGSKPNSWMELEPATIENRIRNLKTADVRAIAFVMLKRMESQPIDDTRTLLDVFDQCVLPIRPRPYGAIPRAFLGGDVAESGEGLGFMKNKLSRYLRHPAIIPKATLLSWATYTSSETVLNGYKGWYYSIKYDGWSAIWTGTKLVTANGRQTITTMPEQMQTALLSVRYPLVGELVLMQTGPSYDTKERLQALVRGDRTADVAARNEIASRIVFMVYDTPSTEHRHMNYGDRLRALEEMLVHPVSKAKFSVTADRVGLIQQRRIKTSSGETLAQALFAAVAAEQEGLMLTPNEPYGRLYTNDYRRRKLKPLYQFTVEPDKIEGDDDAGDTGATLVKSFKLSIPQLPEVFQRRNTPTSNLKINVEGDVWVESMESSKRLRLAKHRWGFHPIITDAVKPEHARDILVLPKGMLRVRDTLFRETVGTSYPAGDTRNLQLWTLVASHFIHPRVFDSKSGRPHYPVHARAEMMLEGTKVVHNVFSGEASTDEVRGLVREASMLAERSAKQPYNEWLCRLHRAYENAALWRTILRSDWNENGKLSDPELKIFVRERHRLPLVPGESYTYYALDSDRTPDSLTGTPYAIYKLVTLDVVPDEGNMFSAARHGRYYTLDSDEDPTRLPARVAHKEFKITSRSGSLKVWESYDVTVTQGRYYCNDVRKVIFNTDQSVRNYLLALSEEEEDIFEKVKEVNAEKDPIIDAKGNLEDNAYTLITFNSFRKEFRGYYLATTIKNGTEQWLFGDTYSESKGEERNLLGSDNKISEEAVKAELKFQKLSSVLDVDNIEIRDPNGVVYDLVIEIDVVDRRQKPYRPMRSSSERDQNWIFTLKRDSEIVGRATRLRVEFSKVKRDVGTKTRYVNVTLEYRVCNQSGDDDLWITAIGQDKLLPGT